jgi:hypothetical protein
MMFVVAIMEDGMARQHEMTGTLECDDAAKSLLFQVSKLKGAASARQLYSNSNTTLPLPLSPTF